MKILILFLMANSASFELREVSTAALNSVLFLRRSSNIETDILEVRVDKLLLLKIEIGTL